MIEIILGTLGCIGMFFVFLGLGLSFVKDIVRRDD